MVYQLSWSQMFGSWPSDQYSKEQIVTADYRIVNSRHEKNVTFVFPANTLAIELSRHFHHLAFLGWCSFHLSVITSPLVDGAFLFLIAGALLSNSRLMRQQTAIALALLAQNASVVRSGLKVD